MSDPEMLVERLLYRLKDRIKWMGLSQETVAMRIGMHRPALTLVLNGRQHLRTVDLFRLAHVLEVSLVELTDDIPPRWLSHQGRVCERNL